MNKTSLKKIIANYINFTNCCHKSNDQVVDELAEAIMKELNIKGCPWYHGKSGCPDLTLCKNCFYKLTCVGRNYLKWKKVKEECDDRRRYQKGSTDNQ